MTETAIREVPAADVVLDLDEAGEEAWLEQRGTGIGGSDAAAIVGADPHKSAFALYTERVSGMRVEENEAMAWGKRLEEPIADEWARRSDQCIVNPRALYRSREWPWMLATPDRLTFTDFAHPADGVLEVKTAGLRQADDWATGPPVKYLMQGYHYLAVTGFDRIHFAALIGGQQFVTYPVERNDALIAGLVKAEREFYERLLGGEPPPVDGSDATTDAVKTLYADAHPGMTVELPEHVLTLLAEREEWMAREAEVSEGRNRVENEIKALLGEAEVGTYAGSTVVTWKLSTSHRISATLVRERHPEIVDDVTEHTSGRRLWIPKS